MMCLLVADQYAHALTLDAANAKLLTYCRCLAVAIASTIRCY